MIIDYGWIRQISLYNVVIIILMMAHVQIEKSVQNQSDYSGVADLSVSTDLKEEYLTKTANSLSDDCKRLPKIRVCVCVCVYVCILILQAFLNKVRIKSACTHMIPPLTERPHIHLLCNHKRRLSETYCRDHRKGQRSTPPPLGQAVTDMDPKPEL